MAQHNVGIHTVTGQNVTLTHSVTRRAKIWGKEPGPAKFSEFNNCKDPRFR
jgi:hypothetical protein